eukprot:CAMPEP_0196666976 /NCGR_PEP_ID=MMETSP1086-20130531/64817_1 /TAXON_ID=77921 /ORGANISM="Cyanoptyche  gloeocystis , Strain SAG4.97" /LENGTH=346 /DNA_ID=CAMNT_0042004243 /DNA_START=45 /DNA_END=1085 /DNA_ORIENTATION=+
MFQSAPSFTEANSLRRTFSRGDETACDTQPKTEEVPRSHRQRALTELRRSIPQVKRSTRQESKQFVGGEEARTFVISAVVDSNEKSKGVSVRRAVIPSNPAWLEWGPSDALTCATVHLAYPPEIGEQIEAKVAQLCSEKSPGIDVKALANVLLEHPVPTIYKGGEVFDCAFSPIPHHGAFLFDTSTDSEVSAELRDNVEFRKVADWQFSEFYSDMEVISQERLAGADEGRRYWILSIVFSLRHALKLDLNQDILNLADVKDYLEALARVNVADTAGMAVFWSDRSSSFDLFETEWDLPRFDDDVTTPSRDDHSDSDLESDHAVPPIQGAKCVTWQRLRPSNVPSTW